MPKLTMYTQSYTIVHTLTPTHSCNMNLYLSGVNELFEDLAQRLADHRHNRSDRVNLNSDSFSLKVEEKRRQGRLNHFVSDINEWEDVEKGWCGC